MELAPPATSTASLHDALPILPGFRDLTADDAGDLGAPCGGESSHGEQGRGHERHADPDDRSAGAEDRKSTRLNSSHVASSYPAFSSKKKQDGMPRGSIAYATT